MGTGTDIGRVRGLGSGGGEGTRHFWLQRVTALANILGVIWLFVSLLRLPNLDHQIVLDWLSQTIVIVPMILFVTSVLAHARLGLRVVVEDYVHSRPNKIFLILAIDLAAALSLILSVFLLIAISFGGVS